MHCSVQTIIVILLWRKFIHELSSQSKLIFDFLKYRSQAFFVKHDSPVMIYPSWLVRHESQDVICHHDLPIILSGNVEGNTQILLFVDVFNVSITGSKYKCYSLRSFYGWIPLPLSLLGKWWQANHSQQIVFEKPVSSFFGWIS